MKPTIARVAIGLSVALIAVACSGGDDAAPTTPPTTVADTTTSSSSTTTSTTTSSTTTTTTEVPEEPILRMPLTGEPIEDESEIPDRPALAVKIGNNPQARPQSGLNEADIVFEENTEGITRFAAVFHSNGVDPLGPIRSGRSQDVDMLSGLNQPLFAWSGGNAGVRAMIRNSDFVDLDHGWTSGYYRRSGRGGAPHNLFSSTDALWQHTPEEFSLPDPMFGYARPEDTIDGQAATTVEVPMDGVRVTWTYDEESGLYLRSQNGNPHNTEASGQVAARNVVVMGVTYNPSPVDRRSPEAQTVGTGTVMVFTDGVARTGVWLRMSNTDPYGLFVSLPETTGDTDDADTDVSDDATDDDAASDDDDAAASDDDDATTVPDLEEIPLQPGITWVLLARDAEDFATWE